MKFYLNEIEAAVKSAITADLIKPKFRTAHPIGGACYIAAEAAWHMLGGPSSGFIPQVAKINGLTHWWLKNKNGQIIDPTKEQFNSVELLQDYYSKGRGCGFLTRCASRGAQVIIDRLSIS